MPRRRCGVCKGTGTLAPGGNEQHRRACGQCLGRGFHFTSKEAPRGTWFEGAGSINKSRETLLARSLRLAGNTKGARLPGNRDLSDGA